MEPPYTEPYVRWCERPENKIGGKLILFSSYSIFTYAITSSDIAYNSKAGKGR